ncbi:MAG: hypothetical protein A2Y38_14075 [Spirochaetes bacterium GWB1_59_5]|nr:MAG: hypothetical protein A2Y38_14075 [Spirochaetes bacterium GWB1_59_5]
MSTQFQSPAECCCNPSVASWQDAVDNLVEFLISQAECFSSGEVVSHIRTHRADLKFKHAWVGERLQNSFANGSFPNYSGGAGEGEVAPVQVTRQTSGLGRTPAGVSVFVYGLDQAVALAHHFEVDVPLPGPGAAFVDGRSLTPPGPQDGLSAAALAMMGGLPTSPPAVPTSPFVPAGTPLAPSTAKGKQAPPGDVVAKVHADGRVCIPKLAFEILAGKTGKPVVGGKALYASWSGLKVLIDQVDGLSTVYPTTDFCRVHLTPPSPLPVGAEYAVVAGADSLTIDFSSPL